MHKQKYQIQGQVPLPLFQLLKELRMMDCNGPTKSDDGYSLIGWIDTEEEVNQPGTEPSIQEEVEPSDQENAKEDIDNDSVFSDQQIDYGSDVHEELRISKEEMRKLRESKRRKKKEKSKVFLGEVGLDEGYEDIEKGKKKIFQG